jgi:hypothetical protein
MPMKLFYLAVALVLIVGCQAQQKAAPKAGPPPIEFRFRKSQVPTKGMVAGLRNASDAETLTEFIVHVRGAKEQDVRSHRVDVPVEPQDTITVGWVELDGWKLKPGDTMTVRCREYVGEATEVVPEL